MHSFHKVWTDQCLATEAILEDFGLEDALHYLVGEKLISFIHASDTHAEFSAELPSFVGKIKELFEPYQLKEYFDCLESAARNTDEERSEADSFDDADYEASDAILEAQRVITLDRAREYLIG